MPASPASTSLGVRRIALEGAGVTLSALLAEAPHHPPRATIVALHGGGMSAGYFDGQAHPDLSLLTLAASLGYNVLSVDRPGYGTSAAQLPEGQTLVEQSATLYAALKHYATQYETGAGYFVLAHSYGGKLALTAAADEQGAALIGLDISGCGHQYAVGPDDLPGARGHGRWSLTWGALRYYPPNTFLSSASLVAPMPAREGREAALWPDTFPDVAARVRVPVRLTFAAHEAWWRHDETAVADLTARLASPRVVIDRVPEAGHNISLGWAARSYHLKALAFLEECLAGRV
ncbi:alpha/beta hydrolase [Streptomyces sp. NPDC002853]